eukprot:CAMPEP_0201516534 /NCGR_PEP_ID=MMETSP0161_2-20130828/7844_1 /ASSEMBLY_ACC=CAM_ASM_000251 /TAXON_ID=180227 /ORGANISM="Neoparamoeba aestuarina, Strain SoJaBio B1-5/56/2" /LENGTH=479 /DNA_ID=CAMNT_0047913707 /DNA_START=40 /DNA_END=1476 /DNA_ORIENTATION=+
MYMEYSSKLLKSLEMISSKKKDQKTKWKATCKNVKARHDIEDITYLVQLPRNRLGYYIGFLSDYLDFDLPGVDLEAEKGSGLNAFHVICNLSDGLDRSDIWKEQLQKVDSTINTSPLVHQIDSLQVPRRFLKKGRVEVKGREGSPINFLVLCTDVLVCCHNDHSESDHVVTFPLADLEVAGEEKQNSFTLGTPEGKWLVTSEVKDKGGWVSLLTSSIKTSIVKLKLFGIPLKYVLRRDQHVKIPHFLTDGFEMLKKNAQTEGIFRLSGTRSKIQELVATLNMRKMVDFTKYDEHTVAGVLKQFFRELPTPLMTFEFYESFHQCLGSKDISAALKAVVMKLPKGNRNVLTFLIGSLNSIAQHQEKNKMSPHNLAIVFSPNLLRSPLNNNNSFDLSDVETKVVECLIEKYNTIFDEAEKDLKKVEEIEDYMSPKMKLKDGEEIEEEEEEEILEGEEGGGGAAGAVVKEGWLTKKGEVRKNW